MSSTIKSKPADGAKMKIVSDGNLYNTHVYLITKDNMGVKYEEIEDIIDIQIHITPYSHEAIIKVSNVELQLLTDKYKITNKVCKSIDI